MSDGEKETDVKALAEFHEWYAALDDSQRGPVIDAIDYLRKKGLAVEFPKSSKILGTDYPLRELRIQVKGRPFRVIYAFDPWRSAVLLLGGDKGGDKRFYKKVVPRAERLWVRYVEDERARRERK